MLIHDLHEEYFLGDFDDDGPQSFLMSLYFGETTINGTTVQSGILTLSGDGNSISSDIHMVNDSDVITFNGTYINYSASNATMYETTNISEYQKYSVKMELYDYAVAVLSDKATPTYEFDVDSANFIFTQELAPFRNNLELGKPIYLRLHNGEVIKPILIEFEVDFEKRNEIDLIFSNRFKRPDNVNTLKDMIESSYSSSHSFDASKYIYGKSVDQASQVSQFMNSSLDAAVNTILGAQNQSVIIDGSGVRIGGDSNNQLRIVDSMIAMSDDGWQSAKLAIGHFYSDEIGNYFGVNADIIGGKLLVGNNLVIESSSDGNVVKQFRFDSTGAWINNGTLTMQMDNGGKILLDPRYGILAGNGSLYTTSGTTVVPSFIDGQGQIVFDNEGFPQNANFFLDLRDGSAYFRGRITSTAGKIGGWTIEANRLSSGSGASYVGLSSNASDTYAIWAGGATASSAPFRVKRNGDVWMTTGTFKGIVQASDYKDSSGNSMMTPDGKFDSDYLELYGITVKDRNNNTVMTIDSNGVSIVSGSISWSNVTNTSSLTQSITNAQNTANSAATAANNAASAAEDASDEVYALARGTYTSAGTTFINQKTIYSANIIGGTLMATSGASNYVTVKSDGLYYYTGTSIGFKMTTTGTGANRVTTITANGNYKFECENTIDFSNQTVSFSNANVSGLYLRFTS